MGRFIDILLSESGHLDDKMILTELHLFQAGSLSQLAVWRDSGFINLHATNTTAVDDTRANNKY